MFIAACNFKAGEGLRFKKGEVVQANAEALKKLQAEGLVIEKSEVVMTHSEADLKVSEPVVEKPVKKFHKKK